MFRAVPVVLVALLGPCSQCNGGASNGLERVDDASFEIDRNDHYGRPRGSTKRKSEFDRFLSFQVRFQSDCDYISEDPVNQHDWNKLMGLSTINVHDDSVRLGWRYEPATDEIELGLYAYRDGERIYDEVASIPLETWADVTLILSESEISVEVDGAVSSVTGRGSGTGLFNGTTWVLRTAYFGGDEKAPQDVHIDVRDIWTDE